MKNDSTEGLGTTEERARELVLRELARLDCARLREMARPCTQDRGTKYFIDLFVGEDPTALSFVVDGRGVWPDISVVLEKSWFQEVSPQFDSALRACVEMINLARSLPPTETATGAGPFSIWHEDDDQVAWQETWQRWSEE